MCTYGVRRERDRWVVYLMWMRPFGDRRWCALRYKRYRSLSGMLGGTRGASAVLFFPPT